MNYHFYCSTKTSSKSSNAVLILGLMSSVTSAIFAGYVVKEGSKLQVGFWEEGMRGALKRRSSSATQSNTAKTASHFNSWKDFNLPSWLLMSNFEINFFISWGTTFPVICRGKITGSSSTIFRKESSLVLDTRFTLTRSYSQKWPWDGIFLGPQILRLLRYLWFYYKRDSQN